MFPSRFFPNPYFAPRYFPKAATVVVQAVGRMKMAFLVSLPGVSFAAKVPDVAFIIKKPAIAFTI